METVDVHLGDVLTQGCLAKIENHNRSLLLFCIKTDEAAFFDLATNGSLSSMLFMIDTVLSPESSIETKNHH